MTYHEIALSKSYSEFCKKVENDIAELVRQEGCTTCRGPLDRSDFPRKSGFGVATSQDHEESLKRISFCCREDGCRQRHTPPSPRFLPGKRYPTIIIVLMSAMKHGLNDKREKKLTEVFGVSRQTIERWRKWWLEQFCDSPLWQNLRRLFSGDIDDRMMPKVLIDQYRKDISDPLQIMILVCVAAGLWRYKGDPSKIFSLIQGLFG